MITSSLSVRLGKRALLHLLVEPVLLLETFADHKVVSQVSGCKFEQELRDLLSAEGRQSVRREEQSESVVQIPASDLPDLPSYEAKTAFSEHDYKYCLAAKSKLN